ncbi:MAG: 30S ribosomal protein S8 [Coxiellaceae bacterium]|nr:30S ribosomal protein S8 [Coxiellaceae bacterium]
MSMQDPISDMLTRIRNAQQRFSESVTMPSSNLKKAIANVLQQEGYISGWSVQDDEVHQTLSIDLKYYQGQAVIENIQRVSKPSLRVYMSKSDLEKYGKSTGVQSGLGVAIVSNSDGVMPHSHAIKSGKGGEVLCYVN